MAGVPAALKRPSPRPMRGNAASPACGAAAEQRLRALLPVSPPPSSARPPALCAHQHPGVGKGGAVPSSPMRKSLPEEALSLWGECIITPGAVPIRSTGQRINSPAPVFLLAPACALRPAPTAATSGGQGGVNFRGVPPGQVATSSTRACCTRRCAQPLRLLASRARMRPPPASWPPSVAVGACHCGALAGRAVCLLLLPHRAEGALDHLLPQGHPQVRRRACRRRRAGW